MSILLGAIRAPRRSAHIGRALLLAALAAATLSAPTSVLASSGAATPFKAAYPTPTPFGVSDWTCSGAHVVNRASVKDSETCLITGNTTGFVAGTYVGNPGANLPPFGPNATWGSDYNGVVATSFIETFVDNGDGTFTMDITAYY